MNPPPPPSKTGKGNPGWPGCCRPPQPSELERIPPADWHAVQTVHKTPIPPEIRLLLDSLRGITQTSNGNNTSPTNSNGGTNKDWSLRPTQTPERKSISRAVGPSPNGTMRSPSSKSRPAITNSVFGSGNSPKTKNSRLATTTTNGGTSPAANGSALSPSVNNSNNSSSNTGSAYNSVRRGSTHETHTPLKRIEGFRTTPPSNMRRLESTPTGSGTSISPVSVNSSKQLPNLTATALSALNGLNGVKAGNDPQQASSKRRGSAASAMPLTIATNRGPSSKSSSGGKNSGGETMIKMGSEKEREREKDKGREKSENVNGNGVGGLEKGLKALQISANNSGSATYHLDSGLPTPTTPSTPSTPGSDSSSSSGDSRSTSSSGSGSEGTVTSDGGFTDYLSDESEAELQRQAEVRAAQVARDKMEELEFRAARKQLANVDLRPPQSWTTGIRKATVGTR